MLPAQQDRHVELAATRHAAHAQHSSRQRCHVLTSWTRKKKNKSPRWDSIPVTSVWNWVCASMSVLMHGYEYDHARSNCELCFFNDRYILKTDPLDRLRLAPHHHLAASSTSISKSLRLPLVFKQKRSHQQPKGQLCLS